MWISKRMQHAALSLTSNECLDHSLLVAKLYWYGLSPLPLKLIFSYFSNRTHHTKIKECFSNRSKKIEYGVPQGLILGPLLFTINSIDMFNECEDYDIENYAVLKIQLHTLALPTLIQLFLNYK